MTEQEEQKLMSDFIQWIAKNPDEIDVIIQRLEEL